MKAKVKRIQSAELLAAYLMWDIADLKECRYHYGHTTKPVFTVGDDYYCIVKDGQKPAQSTLNPGMNTGDHWTWTEVVDRITNEKGYRIYVAKTQSL